MPTKATLKTHFSWHTAILLFATAIFVAIGLIVFNNKVQASSLSITHTPLSGVKSTATNHTFTFAVINAVPANGFVIIYFSDGYAFQSGLDYTDVDLIVDGAQRNLGASASSTNDGIFISSYKLQINVNTTVGISAGASIEIRIGTNATYAQTGDKQVVNPSSTGTGSLNIETNTPLPSMSIIDSGGATMAITNPPGVNLAETSGSTAVSESGSPDTYYISLNSPPSANVTVNISGGTQLTTNKTSLTFTSSNWSTQQSVWIYAVNDALIEGAHTGTLTHTVTSTDSNYNGIAVNNLSVSITDNDTAGVTVTQTDGGTTATEGGATDTYTIVLTSQPTADVTISGTTTSQISATPLDVTFTSANWNTPQTVTVSAVNDSIVEGAHGGTISYITSSADANFNGLTVSSVTVSITDNDTAGVTVTQTDGSTVVTEGGATDTYSVVLTSQPTADVIITTSGDTQISVSPVSLTFTDALWNAPQTITVTAIDDSAIESTHNGTSTHVGSSTNSNYNNIAIADVAVTITDNDHAPAPPPVESPPPSSPSGGGGGGGGGGGFISTPSPTTPAVKPAAEEKSSDLFLDFPGSNKKFLESAITKQILALIQSMLDKEVYKLPKNQRLSPGSIAKRFFAAQIALMLGGKDCGKTVSVKTCLAAAAENGFINTKKPPAIKIQRADYFQMLLKAKEIPLLQKTQLPKNICSDVSNKSEYAQVMATMRAYNIMRPLKDGSCKPKSTMTKHTALFYAVRVSNVSDENIKTVQKEKIIEFE
ncbi:hypothetical protein HYW83_01680 [Candidatus Peregrinibacteria bacterium]|nr:hypothetical protein [Candidatus Peregrinibacteria bacterium]